MGITLSSVQKGDVLCLILGTNVPFVLRKVVEKTDTERNNTKQKETEQNDIEQKNAKKTVIGYKLIGEAYCHALMDGEGMRDQEGFVRDTINFVIL
jgi:hypothetical protein